MRIGMGYDVHRLVEGRKLILGGVDIPYEKGLTSPSQFYDQDVTNVGAETGRESTTFGSAAKLLTIDKITFFAYSEVVES